MLIKNHFAINAVIYSVVICLIAIISIILAGMENKTIAPLPSRSFFSESLHSVIDFIRPPINDTTYIYKDYSEQTGLLASSITVLKNQGVNVASLEIKNSLKMSKNHYSMVDLGILLKSKNKRIVQYNMNLTSLIKSRKPFIVFSHKFGRYQVVKGVLKEKSLVLLGDPFLGNIQMDLFKFIKHAENAALYVQ